MAKLSAPALLFMALAMNIAALMGSAPSAEAQSPQRMEEAARFQSMKEIWKISHRGEYTQGFAQAVADYFKGSADGKYYEEYDIGGIRLGEFKTFMGHDNKWFTKFVVNPLIPAQELETLKNVCQGISVAETKDSPNVAGFHDLRKSIAITVLGGVNEAVQSQTGTQVKPCYDLRK